MTGLRAQMAELGAVRELGQADAGVSENVSW